jgi:hypothetical protein
MGARNYSQQSSLNSIYMRNQDDSTIDIFFFNLSTNPSRYKCQLDVYYVPTVAQATDLKMAKPPGDTWDLPTQSITPQIEL